LPQSAILYIYTIRDIIQADPDYQRLGDVWTLEKRQLFIDSLLNEYDVPKLYFHEFVPPKQIKGKQIRYAIVDGRQRLETIWGFIDGQFALSDTFDYFKDPDVNMRGLTYGELGQKYPLIKAMFDSISQSIMVIQTGDIEIIEDMFSRLNEAVSLSAAEKRNAFGGPLPRAIRRLSRVRFFTEKLPFSNSRYRHFDLASKFLYFEHLDKVSDTKKANLDAFVKNFKGRAKSKATRLLRKSTDVCDRMARVFLKADEVLRSVGMVVICYLLFRDALREGSVSKIHRSAFVKFERIREANWQRAEGEKRDVKLELLEFDRLAQSPNDASAITQRYKVLRKYILRKSQRRT